MGIFPPLPTLFLDVCCRLKLKISELPTLKKLILMLWMMKVSVIGIKAYLWEQCLSIRQTERNFRSPEYYKCYSILYGTRAKPSVRPTLQVWGWTLLHSFLDKSWSQYSKKKTHSKKCTFSLDIFFFIIIRKVK